VLRKPSILWLCGWSISTATLCLGLAFGIVSVHAQSVDVGNSALKATNWTAAESIFRGVLAKNSTNALALAGLAESLLRQRRLEEALASAQKAASFGPTNFIVQYRLGACYYELRLYGEAQAAYAAALEIRPSGSVYFWRGMALEHLKRYKEAAACYRKALALNPKSARNLQHLGDCQYEINDFATAADSYRRCFVLQPTNWQACYWLGLSLDEAGKLAEAQQALQTAAQLNSTNTAVALNLADVLYRLKSYDEARQVFRHALALDPKKAHLTTDFQTTMNIGACFSKEGNYRAAIAAYENASQFEPTNESPYQWEGDSYILERRYVEAADVLAKAHQLKPASREISLALFDADLMAGRDSQACRLFPIASGIGMAALLAGAAIGFYFLLRGSFRLSTATHPGIVFSIGWLLVSFEGQGLLILAASFLNPLRVGANNLAGLALGSLPLLVAAAGAFPKQPWGAPFRRPPEFRWILLGQTVLGLALIYGATQVYSFTLSALFHVRAPAQRSLIFLEQMWQAQSTLAVFAVMVIAPLTEEILFRGLLFGALEEKCGNWTILWTALLFALFHLDPFYFVPLTALGLLLGWARQKSGSVWPAVLLHCLNNLISVIALAPFERLH
jgi:tetratricopeptide (TPR) repeat protein